MKYDMRIKILKKIIDTSTDLTEHYEKKKEKEHTPWLSNYNENIGFEEQLPSCNEIRIKLIRKGIRQRDFIPLLRKKFPELNITDPFISKALYGKYPSFLLKINEVINEI